MIRWKTTKAGGEIASFCTIWFDDVTRTGAFEPVATAPEHLRLGLASAVMREGLRRMKRMGATQATVGSYNEPAHSLYASLGFTDYIVASAWEKNIMIG
jgi:mycothiol synthase